jgi:hypothetical protein
MSTSAGAIFVPRLTKPGKVTQARVVVSEWTKLHSLRSTRWSLLAATVLGIGFPLIAATIFASRWGQMTPRERSHQHPLDVALIGVNVSQLPIAVLGVLVITGEYATGMIRSSLIAVPKRLPVLWAKLGVYAAVSFLLMLPAVLIAFFASQAILRGSTTLGISFSDPGVARTVIGGAVFLMLVGVFALAIGAILRNTAGGIATFAAIFFVIPPLLNVLPTSWNDAITPWLPSESARSMFALTHGPHQLAPGSGLAVFLGYCAFAITVAAVLLRRRDA